MRNYADVVSQLIAAGIIVESLAVDGRIHRCKVDGDRERRGWYVLHLWRPDHGEELIVGSYGVWRGADNGARKVEFEGKSTMTADEAAALKRRLADDRKLADATRKAEASRAARRAEAVWSKALTAAPVGVAVDYLERKGVQSHGLRYTASGALIVPMQGNDGRVHGLQFILPSHHERRRKTGRDKEYWPQGLRKTGHYYLFGGSPAPVLLIAEGYATAATLHQATGLPVAVAFDAGNLLPVAEALRKRYRAAKILICADDDYLQKCKACGVPTDVAALRCENCGAEHGQRNPGVTAAQAAALAVNGAVVVPSFPSDRGGKKITDFNDLQHFPTGGLSLVRDQVERRLAELYWVVDERRGAAHVGEGRPTLKPLLSMDEAARRYTLIYGGKGTFFDHDEHDLIPKQDVLDILPDHAWREWKTRADRKVARLRDVGFDPTGTDKSITCNLWGGWPTQPKAGSCEKLLDLLAYLCANEQNDQATLHWVLCWLAYPIKYPGAKMKTALVFHGPQGTGKNLFFEAVMAIYGEYGRIVDQAAIEDKFNDYASKKLFMVADEVVARQELFHQKNKLKALITGDTIRINPKNVAAHEERNHMNLVFLSNERQPLVLEPWDRRYMVVWTPEAMPANFYLDVGREIAAGGVAALHQYLLDYDIGDFTPHTKPIVTDAKADLIAVSLDSVERFVGEWQSGDTGHPFCPAGSMDLYRAYQRWCSANGVSRPRESNHFIAYFTKLPAWEARAFHIYPSTHCVPPTRTQKMIVPSIAALASAPANRGIENARLREPRVGQSKAHWLTGCFFAFRETVEEHP